MDQENSLSRELSHTATAVASAQSHTPGPWVVLESDSIFDDTLIIADERSSEDLAEVFYADRHTVSISISEARANARLISAAPELLDIAKMILRTDDEWKALSMDERSRVEAAIAKAEGKS